MPTLLEYLVSRGLNLEPTEIDKRYDPIMENEALVKEAAELWETKQPLITMVLQARINAISYEILTKAPPQEVLVLRQALVEIGALITDFERYKGEYGRRAKPEEPKPELVEGAESAL